MKEAGKDGTDGRKEEDGGGGGQGTDDGTEGRRMTRATDGRDHHHRFDNCELLLLVSLVCSSSMILGCLLGKLLTFEPILCSDIILLKDVMPV